MYIHERPDWPKFKWDQVPLEAKLGMIRNRQGRLVGRMEALGFSLRNEAVLETMTLEVMKTSDIEGEVLDAEQVRSSIARRLGIEYSGLIPSDRNVDGIVEVLWDATQNYSQPLTEERLFAWHAALFPTGRSGMQKIQVGAWRNDDAGPMQVVSGPMGKEKVHFEAPVALRLPHEMEQFLTWFNGNQGIDPVLKSALAHFWFVTIHPFDDGNGRMARAIADMQLARADGIPQRFYSMSAQIRMERKEYYETLERSQKGGLDITDWLEWFLLCFDSALTASEQTLKKVLQKARFWDYLNEKKINARQRVIINKLLDTFEGKLTSSKWAKITKCSQDTALRDIQNLINQKILVKDEAGGRSTSYDLINISS